MAIDQDYRFDTIGDAVSAMRAWKLMVVVDDTDRDNEGNLIMAAATATPERMAFMVRHTSGIIRAPMGSERAERLGGRVMFAKDRGLKIVTIEDLVAARVKSETLVRRLQRERATVSRSQSTPMPHRSTLAADRGDIR